MNVKHTYERTYILLKDGKSYRRLLGLKPDSKGSLMIWSYFSNPKIHDIGDELLTKPRQTINIRPKRDNFKPEFVPQKTNFHPDGNITIKSTKGEYLSKYTDDKHETISFAEREKMKISLMITIQPSNPKNYPIISEKELKAKTPVNFTNIAIDRKKPFILDLYYLSKGTSINLIPKQNHAEERIIAKGSPATLFDIGLVIKRYISDKWPELEVHGYVRKINKNEI